MKKEVATIESISYDAYAALCGQVASHATPFFSTKGSAVFLSLTSVVDMGNLKTARAEDADLEVVEAENDEVHIVARTSKSKLGDELYIAYGDPCINLSDTLYRYGFAPDDADVHAAVSLPSSLFPKGCVPTLQTLGLIVPSPWDGLEDTWAIPLLSTDATDRSHAHDALSEGIAVLLLASYVACNDTERRILPHGEPEIVLSPYESCALILLHAHREAIVTAEELMQGVASIKQHANLGEESNDENESDSDDQDRDIWNTILHVMNVTEDSLIMTQDTKAMMLSLLSARLTALDARKSSALGLRDRYAGYLDRAERRTLAVAQEIVEGIGQ